MTGVVVAIDGPSGAGKSTVARAVAEAMGLAYLDTGAMYRACALACIREGVHMTDADSVVAIADTMNLEFSLDPRNPRVFLDGDDVTNDIRGDLVTQAVSDVATNMEARAVLGAWQRKILEREMVEGWSRGAGIVAEGRDITTVVAPDAHTRVLITADPEVRVARRAQQDGQDAPSADVHSRVIGRDAKDAQAVDFAHAADGVTSIDTTALTIDEAVNHVIALVHKDTL